MAMVGSFLTFMLALGMADIVADGYGVAGAGEFIVGCVLVVVLLVMAATGVVSVFPDEDA